MVASQGPLRRWLVEPPPGSRWTQSREANVVDRWNDNVRQGLEFAGSYPGFYLRSRIKRLADWVTPMSYFDRHYRRGLYRGTLAKTGIRRTLIPIAVASTMLVMAATLPGLFWALPGVTHRMVVAIVFLTFVAPVAVTAISRYRVPVEPLMLVLAAGLVAGAANRRRPRNWEWVAMIGGWVVLVTLWLINAKEVWIELSRVW